MDKAPKKVFISGASREMKEFREAALRAIQEAGMEAVTLDFQDKTSNFSPLELNKKTLQECDVFVGLYGFEPVWIPPESEKYIVELEYEWAMNKKMPMFLYIPQETEYSGHIPTQPDERMTAFKETLQQHHVVGFLTTPENLTGDLLRRLMNLQSESEADIAKGIERKGYKKAKKDRPSVRLSSGKLKEHRALGEISRGNRVLRQGHRGKAVTAIQNQLIQAGVLETDSPDGVFGPETEAAVKSFQSQHNLTPDGIIGPATLEQLDAQATQMEAQQGETDQTEETAEPEQPEQPEIFEPERALYNNDQATIKDSLNMETQAERFARLFVAEDVDPPLSLGLFGNWGVGKTYFMQLMRQKITTLTEAKTGNGKSPYVGRVAQITFNAWHYTDADLWANLAVRIFDGLAEELQKNLGPAKDENNYENIRRRLRSEIHSSRETKRMAEQRQEQAQADRQEAAKKLQDLKADSATKKSQFGKLRLSRLIDSDDHYRNYRKDLKSVAKEFGFAGGLDTVDDIVKLARQFRQLDGRFKTLLSAIGGRFQGRRVIWTAIALAAFFFLIIFLKPLTEMLVARLPEFFQATLSGISGTVVQIVALISSALTWIGRQFSAVSGALDKLEAIQSGLEKLKTDPDVAALEARVQNEIETLDAEIRKEEEKIYEANRRIAEAEAEIQRINAGGLVYDFTKDRTKDPHYLEHLGIISVIRKDFEELGDLLKDWRIHSRDGEAQKDGGSPPAPIQRIILYIDDLDRCHPDRVVEVLQAVHLLLALPLFNIVVAVDARWLERSLYKAYLPKSVADKLALGERIANIEFSPQQYLEKIFQIPFSLPYMSESGYHKLVDDLILTRKEYEKKLLEESDSQKSARVLKEATEIIKTGGQASEAHDIEHDQSQESEEQVLENTQTADVISQNLNAPFEGEAAVKEEHTEDLNRETELPENEEPLTARPSEEVMQKSLLLEDNEQAYLQAVHGFIDTPRLTKRLINIYRLIRVTAVEKGFDKFILDSQGGEYRAAIILLAINIGFPQISASLFHLLISRREDKSWSTFLKALDQVVVKFPRLTSPVPKWARGIEWSADDIKQIAKILSHLKKLDKEYGMPDDLNVYRTWAPEVGRYSFYWHLQTNRATGGNNSND